MKKMEGGGKKVVMNLDNGFGCTKGKTNTQCVLEEIKNSEYDQEIPQSQTADIPVAP